jgi:rod shape-determining protein MreC
MEAFLSRYRNLSILLLTITVQLVLLAYQVKSNQDVRLIRVWAVTAVTPLARVLEGLRGSSVGFIKDYFVLLDVREENRKLKTELGRLKMENQFLKTELATADRAQALAAFQSRIPSRTIAARIIGTGTGANSQVVFVDRGSTNGVMRGMAVVTPDGIVGKVLAAYPTAAQVLLITDPSFAAGVVSQKNRVHGTLKGQGRSSCLVDHVQNEEKVDIGELFFTSGDDRVFPKGLPVGEVRVLRQGKTFKEIYLAPTGFQNGLEEVLIVLEAVHQPIPDAQTAVTDLYLAPPPPQNADQEAGRSPTGVLSTDADRLRERYKRLGDAQGHVFGQGTPGSKPPNFNLNPADIKPKPAAVPAQQVKPPAAPPASGQTAGTPPVVTNPGDRGPAATPAAPAPPAARPVIAPVKTPSEGSPPIVVAKPEPDSPKPQLPAAKPEAIPVKPESPPPR